MAVLVGSFCGLAHILVPMVLGAEFVAAIPLAIALTAHLIINVGVSPLFGLQLALGYVKIPGIVTLILGVCNVTLGVMLAGIYGLGAMGIALAGCAVLTLKNAVFTPWYAARMCGCSAWPFVRESATGVLLGGIIYASARWTAFVIGPDGWLRLILVACAVMGVSLIATLPITLALLRPVIPKGDSSAVHAEARRSPFC
jgi:hypothetical protein